MTQTRQNRDAPLWSETLQHEMHACETRWVPKKSQGWSASTMRSKRGTIFSDHNGEITMYPSDRSGLFQFVLRGLASAGHSPKMLMCIVFFCGQQKKESKHLFLDFRKETRTCVVILEDDIQKDTYMQLKGVFKRTQTQTFVHKSCDIVGLLQESKRPFLFWKTPKKSEKGFPGPLGTGVEKAQKKSKKG